MVDSATSVTAGNLSQLNQKNNPATNTTQGQGLSGDLNTFLRLFTTQLQNQDPTQPLETNEITAQLAQFSTVEQQVKTNTSIDKLVATQKQTQLSTAVSYINKEIESSGNTGTLQGGQATFSYFLPANTSSALVTITNAAGRAVFQGQGTLLKGRNLVVWDGKNSFNQNTEPNGKYTISIAAKDANNKTLTVDTRSVGIVTGVETDSTGIVKLNVGDVSVPFDQILAVREPVLLNLGTQNATQGTTQNTTGG
jgi:flagellar basal-body rod modification protein FlgD